MPQRCTVCDHPSRDAIDHSLVTVGAKRRIAAEVGVSEQAIRRHAARHLPIRLVESERAASLVRANSLAERVAWLAIRAESVLEHSMAEGRGRTALAAIRELRYCVELLGRVQGELGTPATVTVLNQIGVASVQEARKAIELRDSVKDHTEEEMGDLAVDLLERRPLGPALRARLSRLLGLSDGEQGE